MPSLIADFSVPLASININKSDVCDSQLELLKDYSVVNYVLSISNNHAELVVYHFDYQGEDWISDALEEFHLSCGDSQATVSHLWGLLGISSTGAHNIDIGPIAEGHTYRVIGYFKLEKTTYQSKLAYQVREAYVDENYREIGLGVKSYIYLREKLSIILSDRHQTLKAMYLWLNKLSQVGDVLVYDLNEELVLGKVIYKDLSSSPYPLWGLSHTATKPHVRRKRLRLEGDIDGIDDYYLANICHERDYTDTILVFIKGDD